MNKKKNLDKLFKIKKALLVTGIAILLFGLIGIIITIYNIVFKTPNLLADVKKNGSLSQIEVNSVSPYFATLTKNANVFYYYFVTDDKNTYIAILDDNTLNALEENLNHSKMTIEGIVEEIPTDVKNFAIEYYQSVEEVNIDLENFTEYIYPYMINTQITKTDLVLKNCLIFGVITFIGVIFILLYLDSRSKIKKSLRKYEKSLDIIKMELKKDNCVHIPVCKAYVTDNYLISYNKGLNIIEYKNILWLYPFLYRRKGIDTQKSIYIFTKEPKKYVVGNIKAIKKNSLYYNQLYQLLLEKTPDAIHGYSKDNKEKFNQFLR